MAEQNPAEQTNVTIYVTNLPFSTDGKELANHFSQFGEISQSRIISYMYRGRQLSRGFGFVDFKTPEGFNKALNHKEPIIIESNNRKRRAFVAEARARVHHPLDTIFLRNLEESTNEEDIRSSFPNFKIVQVRIPKGRPNRPQQHFAFVKFENEEVFTEVMKLGNVTIKGQEIKIARARPPVKFTRPYFRRGLGRGRGRRGRGRGRGRGGRGRSIRGRGGKQHTPNSQQNQQATANQPAENAPQ